MKKNNKKLIIIYAIITILSLIVLYGGQFLFSEGPLPDNTNAEPGSTKEVKPVPVEFKHVSTTINGFKQEIFTLEFNPLDERVEFKPVLSFDKIFGFEEMSEICKRTGAYAAINAGFFYEFGDPVGMVVTDGNLLTAATGYSPVLVIDEKGVGFKNIKSEVTLIHGNGKTAINEVNRIGKGKNVVLYTSDFGSTNRAKITHKSIMIKNDSVTAVISSNQPVHLNEGSYLISFYGESIDLVNKLGIKKGDSISLSIKPKLEEKYHAYECGSMLVKDSKAVAPDKDRWVGTLNNRDPRTAIGIKENGNVMMIVVDGRQPGYSTGFTGKELADYLVSIGVKDAAMLDGGATSQMFIEGKLQNKPSDRGIARPVAGAFIVEVRNQE